MLYISPGRREKECKIAVFNDKTLDLDFGYKIFSDIFNKINISRNLRKRISWRLSIFESPVLSC